RLRQEIPPGALTPFVFSDPGGKRWPRLRLILLITSVLVFVGTVLFVQTLFVAPQMRVPFSLRQLKGQLKALQKQNPAGQVAPASSLWQKFGEARHAANKGIALMPLLTNRVGDAWQPEAIENLAHGPAQRQDAFISRVRDVLRNAKAAGVVVDWEQIDPAYKNEITAFVGKFSDVLH